MSFSVSPAVERLCEEALGAVRPAFEDIDATAWENQKKVQRAFYDNRVSDTHFAGTTGYGYDDRGRDVCEAVFAQIFGCESAIVRYSLVSGTHALCVALFGVMRPGRTLLAVTGKPYDTLDEVIGLREGGQGSLREFGIGYRQVDMKNGEVDFDGIRAALKEDVSAVFIQRSKGYDLMRPTLSSEEVGGICSFVKGIRSDVVCIVDNCYGEFVDLTEPTQHGADIIVGSLIKNPGGGMARGGAYIAGRRALVDRCACRMTAPGIGAECGATYGQNGEILKGLFFAPHVTAQALKTAQLCAAVMKKLGYDVSPEPGQTRHDIIQTVRFNEKEPMIAFIQGVQKGAPVDSFAEPQPWAMPGYGDEVIMAAGAFVQGASIELSADAPVRPPYIAYMQGGLTFESGRLGIMLAVQSMLDKGSISL